MSKRFKYQIEQELKKHDWAIVQINSTEKWWDDEHWKICHKYNSGVCFYLCFIIDPMSEQKTRIGEIKATSKFPENWNDDTHTIASIQMQKGKFDQKLNEFINNIKSR